MEIAMQHLQTFRPAQIRAAVVHHKTTAHCKVDYYAKKVIKWRWLMYPWAVYEDISGFLMRQSPIPESLKEAQTLLSKQYNINISLKRLEDIYASMGWHS